MADRGSTSAERVIELSGQTSGEASAKVVELATALGYTVAATAPGSYRLARTRRKMLVVKHVESVTITVSEDRTGTRARIVGDVDPGLVEHLSQHAWPQSDVGSPVPPSVHRGAVPAVETPPITPNPASSQGVQTPPPAAPRPRADGLITTPSWGSAPSEPASPIEPPPAERIGVPAPTDGDVEDRTIARSSIRRDAPTVPSVRLPDGRVIPLASAVVLGRDPDPARGPGGARSVAVPDPSVSKTHAVVESDADGIWITDLHSTNGTSLEAGDGATVLEPGVRMALPIGTVARLGDVMVTAQGAS